jgi:hypothetical protein
MMPIRLGAALAAMILAPASVHTQESPLDRGVLLIMRGEEVIGREEFAVRGGGTSASAAAFTIASTALYPADRPAHVLTSVVELGPDSLPTVARLEIGNGETLTVIIGIGPRRITVRRGTATTESAREYPARERPVIIDDSVFAPFAVRLPVTAVPKRALSLEGSLGNAVEARLRGRAPTRIGPQTLDLESVEIDVGREAITAWYDAAGRLIKLEWPARGLTVIREPQES